MSFSTGYPAHKDCSCFSFCLFVCLFLAAKKRKQNRLCHKPETLLNCTLWSIGLIGFFEIICFFFITTADDFLQLCRPVIVPPAPNWQNPGWRTEASLVHWNRAGVGGWRPGPAMMDRHSGQLEQSIIFPRILPWTHGPKGEQEIFGKMSTNMWEKSVYCYPQMPYWPKAM